MDGVAPQGTEVPGSAKERRQVPEGVIPETRMTASALEAAAVARAAIGSSGDTITGKKDSGFTRAC